jgi:isopenicillin N synthase-like dioxygenase
MAPEKLFSSDAASEANIPIVDFARWNFTTSIGERRLVAQELVEACRRVGFVYVVNHGVTSELVAEAFYWSKKLFDLKQEEKLLAPHPDGHAVHRGYSWPGLEKVTQIGHMAKKLSEDFKLVAESTDFKESYEIGSETNNDQPNVWVPEDILPGFRAFMNRFYWECHSVAQTLLRAIAVGIGLEDEDFFMQFHSGQNNQLRLLHYPPVPATALAKKPFSRLPAHTDWGSITMLFQDDCGGLEVEDPARQGHFVFARPVPGALIMNVGDLLQRWSNNRLKSTLHRVVAPPDTYAYANPDSGIPNNHDRYPSTSHPNKPQRLTRARYSIPYFVSPDIQAVVECLPTCTDEEHPVLYEPVMESEYRLMRASVQYPTLQKGNKNTKVAMVPVA